jgi:hypothetical protein
MSTGWGCGLGVKNKGVAGKKLYGYVVVKLRNGMDSVF